jgi:hypothetical protein
MTKIAINRCYGGFGLSEAGLARYAELKGLSAQEIEDLWSGDIERHDSILIQVLEEMGEDSWGDFAEIEIEEVAPGTKYIIDEYDGMENIMTIDAIDWKIA